MLCYARMNVESNDAENVVKALKPDDPDWCKCRAEGGRIVIEIEVRKISTLLSALDDYLMNIKMCEKLLRVLPSSSQVFS